MKLPNGYGSVYKLKGKRRKPWVARKTVGSKLVPETMKTQPVYKFIGYYETRQEALTALGNYNANPYNMDMPDMPTFREVYEMWSEGSFEELSANQILAYKGAAKSAEPVMDMPIKDIRLIHLQRAVDLSGKNEPSARRIKTLYKQVFTHAVKHEFITPEKASIVNYVEIKAGNPDAKPHKIISKEEIGYLWETLTEDYHSPLGLFLIYSGMRIEEAISMKKENVHLDERYMEVVHAKTSAGLRQVPIAEKVAPFVEGFMDTDSRYLIKGMKAERVTKTNIYKPYYKDVVWHGLDHNPHDARHTCVSLLTEAEVDERVIRAIVGHAGQGVTEKVYTHISLEKKLEAINLI